MDFRETRAARRQSWYGWKRRLKWLLGLRGPHAILRRVRPHVPALRESGRLPAPARVKEVVGEAGGVRFVMLRPDRCIVAKELYWGHGHRPRPQDHRAVEVFATLAREADVCLDIGAYTGLFTLVATRVNPRLEAHAFEIVPDVYQALFDNCVRNDVLHRTTLHHVGIGWPGEVTMPARSTGSALPDFYSARLRFDRGVRVRIRPLDDWVEALDSRGRTIVKVDVEG